MALKCVSAIYYIFRYHNEGQDGFSFLVRSESPQGNLNVLPFKSLLQCVVESYMYYVNEAESFSVFTHPYTTISISSSHSITKTQEETVEYAVNWLLGFSVFRSVFGQ